MIRRCTLCGKSGTKLIELADSIAVCQDEHVCKNYGRVTEAPRVETTWDREPPRDPPRDETRSSRKQEGE